MININPKEWVFYGRWPEKPMSVSYWILNKKSDKEEYQRYNPFVVSFLNLDGDYYMLKSQSENTIKVIREILETDFGFFNFLFDDLERVLKRYQKICSGKKDINKFLSFLEENKELYFLWNVLSQLNKGITLYLEEKTKNFTDVNYFEYISINKDTLLSKEQKELRKLFLLFKEKNHEFEEALKNYLNEYEFLGTHCFAGIPQTKESVITKLETFEIKEEKPILIKKDDFFETHKELLKIASDLAYYRLVIVATFDEVSYQFWDFLKSLSKKYNINFEEITHYTYPELIDLIKEAKVVDKNLIEQRQKAFGIIREGNDLKFILNDELKELKEKLSNKNTSTLMKGSVAFRGSVKGTAKIINRIEDLAKVKKGDILVSFETTPDYIIAMSKAAAFVTEQGGITSHAAIVAREMGKPCIVAVENVTKILKNGDLVEVDADKGIVRKIE
jgi:phosphoenolpyruvate synthase/pyruvate phosphate dikinase